MEKIRKQIKKQRKKRDVAIYCRVATKEQVDGYDFCIERDNRKCRK